MSDGSYMDRPCGGTEQSVLLVGRLKRPYAGRGATNVAWRRADWAVAVHSVAATFVLSAVTLPLHVTERWAVESLRPTRRPWQFPASKGEPKPPLPPFMTVLAFSMPARAWTRQWLSPPPPPRSISHRRRSGNGGMHVFISSSPPSLKGAGFRNVVLHRSP